MSVFTLEEKLDAVERAVAAFRWGRSYPESPPDKTFRALKEIASEIRDAIPPDRMAALQERDRERNRRSQGLPA